MKRHWPLILSLFITNGYFIFRLITNLGETNEVGRQWIRLIIPAIMIILSIIIIALYFCIRKFFKYIFKNYASDCTKS